MKSDIVIIPVVEGFDLEYSGKVSECLRKIDGIWVDILSGVAYYETFDKTWIQIVEDNEFEL